MKAIGIIAEFNPLHKGHEYFIREARIRSGADAVVAVMSGDYVQRGEPAIWNKYIRAEAALYAGADLVLELPVSFSAGSAAVFAQGACAILDDLGIIGELWFGSETGKLYWFDRLSDILSDEPPAFSSSLQTALKSGLSFPKAREAALTEYLKTETPSGAGSASVRKELKSFLEQPNNILGLEYCIALKKRKSRIAPRTLPRIGSAFHDLSLGSEYASASAVRLALAQHSPHVFSSALPEFYTRHFDPAILSENIVCADDFSLLLRTRLLSETQDSLTGFLDINEDLARRILKHEAQFRSYTQFIRLVKTKNITYSHVSRALLHILLDIRREDPERSLRQNYIRMLAINRTSAVTAQIRKKSRRMLCAGPAFLKEDYAGDLYASHLYESVYSDKTGEPFHHEYKRKMLSLP